MSTDRDHKIEKINAYQKLLGVTLKKVSQNDMVQAEVQVEFIEFLNDQLNELMGNDTPKEDDLTSEEKLFLKSFIYRAQSKTESNSSAPTKQLNKNEGTTTKSSPKKDEAPYIPRNVQPPLGNKKMEREKGGTPHANQDVISRLDDLDKKYENEW